MSWPLEKKQALQKQLRYSWNLWAREKQRLPDGDWTTWLLLAGRGFGKTRAGAETVRIWVRDFEYVNLVGATADDARDIMIEGESGILAVCPPDERPLYLPSKRRLDWPNGAKSLIFTADEPERLRGKQHEKLWCFTAGTMVATPSGDVPIEHMSIGDLVETRSGPQPIVATGNRSDGVGTVRFSNGASLTGTGEHPVLTSHGWTKLDSLSVGQYVRVAISAPTSALEVSAASARTSTSTAGCGNNRTGRFLLALKSIIATAIRSTTRSTIWSVSPAKSIALITRLHLAAAPQTNVWSWRVLSAGPRWYGAARTPRPSALSAIQPRPKPSARASVSAATAALCSSLGVETTVASVASTWAHAGRQRVYNLTVSGAHEYVANGVLVHNCDELGSWRYPESWDQARFGLRLGTNPQALVTTTPKPTKLVKGIMADPTTVVTRGSTYENRANLAGAFFRAVIRKYEGTRLGRQELLAELLTDTPGALWTYELIEAFRVAQVPVFDPVFDVHIGGLVRIVVAIDPAVTSNEDSDETGIVVAGLGPDGHGYVLEDRTLRGTPAEWATEAVAAYRERMADRIIGEVNNGGEMVGFTVATIDPAASYKPVHASRGKQIRAEPISALYEQGRIHHVGIFPELEDQMTGWVPGMKSPDRLDALVWAFTELFLEAPEIDEVLFYDDPVTIGPQI